MSPAEIANRIKSLDWSATSLQHQLAVGAALTTLRSLTDVDAPSNVVALPVARRTCWTSLHHLDGTPWAKASHFGPVGAWNWIAETVAKAHDVSEDQVGNMESDESQPYDCDDLVTVDGLPVYRIQHFVS